MKFNFLCVLAVLLITLNMTGQALAQTGQPDTDKIPPIPSYSDELSYDEFVAASDVYEEVPLGDHYLAYKVRLPKKWRREESGRASYMEAKSQEEDEFGLSQRLLGEVAQYFGPVRLDALSRFDVKAQNLEYEVTAKNWFIHEILSRGYSLEGLNVYSDRRVEALYVVVEKDTAYVVRAIAEINGPRMVVASYYVPDTYWEKERAEQEWAMKSFQFVSPEQTRIEMTRTYDFLDLLTLRYPASWRLIAPNIFSIEGMEAKLVNSLDDKTLNGEIHVTILSNEYENVLAEEVRYIKEDMQGRGLDIGELKETLNHKYEFEPHVLYSHVEAYSVVDADKNVLAHELWLAVMEEDRYYYVVWMLTPGRDGEFYTWARNGEAFETVITSIKP